MKALRHAGRRWFFAAALLLMLWPVYGRLADRSRFVLQGVGADAELDAPNAESVADGSWMSDLDDWCRANLPGRTFLIRVRNQVLYTLLGTSSNENVAIGQDDELYEELYITGYLGLDDVMTEDEAAARAAELEQLQALLRENGKELYLFITPSKARFVQDYPWYYRGIEKQTNNYDRLTAALAGSSVPVFDSVRFMEENADWPALAGVPMFYKTGTHWDHCWGNTAAALLVDQITAETRWDLAHIEVGAAYSEELVTPNADLYNLLNLLPRADIENYAPVLSITEGADRPGLLMRGSSFIDESLQMLAEQGVFAWAADVGNVHCTVYEDGVQQSSEVFGEYEELDMAGLMAHTDIVVIECNESLADDPGWGLAAYLLAHPELVVPCEGDA